VCERECVCVCVCVFCGGCIVVFCERDAAGLVMKQLCESAVHSSSNFTTVLVLLNILHYFLSFEGLIS